MRVKKTLKCTIAESNSLPLMNLSAVVSFYMLAIDPCMLSFWKMSNALSFPLASVN